MRQQTKTATSFKNTMMAAQKLLHLTVKVFLLIKNGNTNINLPTIQKVSIDNILDLKSHIIMRDGDLTVHNIELLDGGTVKIAFTTSGELVKFYANNVCQTITKDNVVIIKKVK